MKPAHDDQALDVQKSQAIRGVLAAHKAGPQGTAEAISALSWIGNIADGHAESLAAGLKAYKADLLRFAAPISKAVIKLNAIPER